ncbi:MAG: hypothetical protein A2725_01290 [Candidatus Magasanikbacteria bacterium RIFCSPHIGHO2_01_FULL_33_34]|uniref:HTH luxR-type domain-containing protein n=1 Tax=Candidatus Magasanikbacteria bacterium RIFCSPHIGHO2_01_FULL_33_34 TaxID=1798671 RepID=A0A1F6LJG5_9BACT|nr:MAG: hypothetical protein A2725_01290 [Candidatus Magasanikbacteria bacterium RIFCSPHIGHO2_01_FULL_33_34]OGH65388.1 MAG: hypothetical protein A3B83_04950 [Candidatus Magasanikbacteria bacterium RIFCSPHIGHO2_02_FULL_33_17]OGH76164.1 MAG: hypothetical protein A3A89_01870 [Candidatus Magasanikbacteria bacterium RIFCSPLOWO2_01_FULL_33_34]OGH81023.1 MAG: hypothetical protein A3F93_04560 [Candidatus Magasanikbacteria bacterium RIFCSPLOWO2_12_FULL_34_7]
MKTHIEEKLLVYKVISKRDTEAFAKLYDFYIQPIYRFVFFKLSNREDAEDISSEVFLKTWDYLIEKPRDITSFRQLVYRIARNRIIDVYRERARKNECLIDVATETLVGNDLRIDIEVKEEQQDLIKSIKKLKHEYQEVIHLRYIEGLSTKDIAGILDISATNVRIIIYRATKKLKEFVEPKSPKKK